MPEKRTPRSALNFNGAPRTIELLDANEPRRYVLLNALGPTGATVAAASSRRTRANAARSARELLPVEGQSLVSERIVDGL